MKNDDIEKSVQLAACLVGLIMCLVIGAVVFGVVEIGLWIGRH